MQALAIICQGVLAAYSLEHSTWVAMERCVTVVHRLVAALLPLVPQLAPAGSLRRVLHRMLPYSAALLRIAFQNEAAEPGTEVDVVETNLSVEPPEPAEDEVDMPAIENVIQAMSVVHTPLAGSLYGILNHHDP